MADVEIQWEHREGPLLGREVGMRSDGITEPLFSMIGDAWPPPSFEVMGHPPDQRYEFYVRPVSA